MVDLSSCQTERGFEALPSPLSLRDGGALEPDFQLMLSKSQLNCLKRKLEEPGLVLDPSAKIELAGCG